MENNWNEIWGKGRKISKEMEDYIKQYQNKICIKCSKQERKRRRCRIWPISGTICDHLMNARTRKFGREVDNFLMMVLSENLRLRKGGN